MMHIYDPRGMTWDQWCRLTNEQFAAQQLGILPEDKWREWADGMANNGFFMSSGVPTSLGFSTWKDWAVRLLGAMSVFPGNNNFELEISNQFGSNNSLNRLVGVTSL